MPSTSFSCVKMLPKYGLQQILWSRQYELIKNFETFENENNLKSWFDSNGMPNTEKVDIPTEEEGYDVKEMLIPLTTTSMFKLDLPGLLIQWEAVKDEKEQAHQQIIDMCQQWLQLNPCGRILISCDGKDVSKGLCSTQEEHDTICMCVKQLANQVGCPIYVIRITSTAKVGNFNVPPKPGLLAFSQLRHLVNLHDKNTVYIFNSEDHMKMAESVGVRHVKITSVLKSPNAILKGYGQMSLVPDMLKDLEVKKETHAQLPDVGPPLPCVPLYDEFVKKSETGHAVCKHPNGLEEHMFVKDWDSFLQYQELFAMQVTPVDEQGCKSIRKTESFSTFLSSGTVFEDQRKRTSGEEADACVVKMNNMSTGVRSWMVKRPKREPTVKIFPTLKKESSSSSRSWKTIYILSERELKDMAKRILSEESCLGV